MDFFNNTVSCSDFSAFVYKKILSSKASSRYKTRLCCRNDCGGRGTAELGEFICLALTVLVILYEK